MAINDNCPNCNYPYVGPGKNYKGVYNPGQPCPYCSYNELGRDPKVSDLGRHRTLKKEVAEEIKRAFTTMAVSMREAPPEHLALMLARNAIGYLELPIGTLQGWYER